MPAAVRLGAPILTPHTLRGMDERIASGMAQMLAARETAFFDGARRLGWKVGFNTPAGMQVLGIDAPIVGYLTDGTLLPDGATVSVDGFTGAPMLEQEIAVRIGEDGAIVACAAALEVVDLGDPRVGVEKVLAANVFHHAVILGEFTDDLGALTEEIRAIVRHIAGLLGAAGEALQAGDVVITGAMTVEPVKAGDVETVDFGALGTLSVRFDA
jgi:2-oxo-3-hexenedioate decarboxylase